MTKHGAAAAAFLIAVVATAGAAAPVAAAGPHDDLLAKEGARLAAAAGDPGAAGSLAVVAGLEEDVDPRALEAAVRGGTGRARILSSRRRRRGCWRAFTSSGARRARRPRCGRRWV